MRRWRWWAAGGAIVLAAGVVGGCQAPAPEAGALVLATLDTHHFCDDAAVVEVRLRAHWQACPQADRECSPPPRTVIEGDRYTCPATDATHELGVSLTHPGRYRMEAVARLTTGQEERECFVDPASGDPRIELPEARLLGQAPVVLDEHGECPP
jgi:hypothetical protein